MAPSKEGDATKGGNSMKEVLTIAVILSLWILLQAVVLPRLGIQT